MTKSTERIVILVVLGVWAVTMLAPVVVHDFQHRPEVSAALMAVLALIKGTPNRPDPTSSDHPPAPAEQDGQR